MVAYLDTSAAVKLAIDETESEALSTYLDTLAGWTSSALLRAELVRAASRMDQSYIARARIVLRSITLRDIDDEVLDRAAEFAPRSLGTLDAIHLATASLLGPDLEVLVTYDRRMIEAAQLYGLPIASPA